MDGTTLTASGLALLGVVFGAWLGARSTRSQWLKETQLVACQRLMERYAELYEHLALSRRGDVFDQSWASWNQALTEVSLVCVTAVVDAAAALDEQFWRIDWAIRGGHADLQTWIEQRRPLDAARVSFIHTVRRQTATRYRRRVRTSGRPPEDDPLWRSMPTTAAPVTAPEPQIHRSVPVDVRPQPSEPGSDPQGATCWQPPEAGQDHSGWSASPQQRPL